MSRRQLIWGSGAVLFVLMLLAAHFGETKPKPPANSLRWGGDATGGAPYIYQRHGQQTGFETELAAHLAEQLDLQPWFVQGTWEILPKLLDRNSIDIVLNGYEWTPQREKEWASTIPYYSYSLDLIVHKDNDAIRTWEDLHHPPLGRKYRVGVLADTAAHHYLEREFGEDIQIEAYSEGVTSAMWLVKNRALDATIQDHPAAIYYVVKDEYDIGFRKNLRLVEPDRVVAPGYYVVLVRPSQPELRDKLNGAIRTALAHGKLKKIYTKYGLWANDRGERQAQ